MRGSRVKQHLAMSRALLAYYAPPRLAESPPCASTVPPYGDLGRTDLTLLVPGPARPGRRAILLALISFVLILSIPLFAPGAAEAAYTHLPVEGRFAVGECGGILSIAVDESGGYVYVSCAAPYPEPDYIKRFHLNGTPANFSASASYISGNELTGDPDSAEGTFPNFANPQLAVDNSASPNHGELFVSNSPNVDIFKPSGEYAAAIVQPVESSIQNRLGGVAVGPTGTIYVTSKSPGDRVSMYNPALREIKRLYGSNGKYFESEEIYGTPFHISVDSTGAIWDGHATFFGTPLLTKYEADQFTEELSIPAYGATPEQIEPWIAKPSPFVANPLLNSEFSLFDVDLTTNDLYVDRGNRIEIYSQGTPEEESFPDAPLLGEGTLEGSNAVAVTKDHHVYASTSGTSGPEVVIFPEGAIIPNVRTARSNLEEVGHTTATLKGEVDPAGGDPVNKCFIEYAPNASYTGPEVGTATCSPDASSSNFTTPTEVSANLSGLTEGQTYHYRLVAGNDNGTNMGIDRTFIPAYVLDANTLPADSVDTSGATLEGTLNPDGIPTTFGFQYGLSTGYGQETAVTSAGSGSLVQPVSQAVTGLPSGRIFHYRLVATNSNGTTYGPDRTFRTAATPDIAGVRTTEVTGTSAVLRARINPDGYETKYNFVYGPSTEYGNSAPADLTDIGNGVEPVDVEQKVESLSYGVTYHFRVVAENQWGTTESSDTTFEFTPPKCPNEHVRQQTDSSYLPDCRAYELVSPAAAGAVLLYPSHAISEREETLENSPFGEHIDYPMNPGFATGPSHFAFFGGIGSITGLYAPNSVVDMYMASRTNSGWVTSLPGLNGAEAYETGRKECNEAMTLCVDHSESESYGFHMEAAPYLFMAAGEKLEQLPTDLSEIPEGEHFRGQERMSGDFHHFVFGSAEWNDGPPWEPNPKPAIPFASGGLSSGMGSLYDNDLDQRTVSVISKLPDGSPLPEEVPTNAGIQIPGVSPDGSHILMATPAAGGLSHLFMRVGGGTGVTYDVSKGAAVHFVAMDRTGATVYFVTAAQLLPADTDSSEDLYMWSEATDSLTLISQGNGDGNTDECNASWTTGCSVKPLSPEFAHPNGNQTISAPSAMDDLIAENSGDIYFYSPELLDPTKPGIKNERNLYVYHDGAVHLVATFDPGTEVNRMQISPDGEHAAMVTASQLTSYQSDGFKEMYTYEPTTGVIRCASCNPSGVSPTGNVVASQGGRFMSNDGRVFFTTPDALVPRDRDGKVLDVYEYVDGRPQLITSGLGSRDFTGGSEVLSLLLKGQYTGLEAVSREGTDVYFSTYESLVTQDENGEFVKFYDARTNGGFPDDPQPAPCAAADECHGEASQVPPPSVTATTAKLGQVGNVGGRGGHRRKHPKHPHKRQRAHAHKQRRRGHSHGRPRTRRHG